MMMDYYFYISQALVLVVVALWIIGGRKMKKKKMKNEITSEVVEDDYAEEDDYADSGQRVVSPPSAPLPKQPIISEDEQIFNAWLSDWHQRFQYFSDANAVANSTKAEIKNQEMLLLIGLAHNTDLLINEQRNTNKLLRELIKTQE